MKKILKALLVLLLILCALGAGMLTAARLDQDAEDAATADREDAQEDAETEQEEVSLEAYDELTGLALVQQINRDCEIIVGDYVNEYGEIEYDTEILEESSTAVYEWGLTLAEEGIIDTATYCDIGYTVAFFLNDGTTSLYIPQIAGAYSGEGDFAVMSVVGMGSVSNAAETALTQGGSVKSANYIYENVEECTEHIRYNSGNNIAELKLYLGGLGSDNVRAVFWRGHGNVYTHSDGTLILGLVTAAKVTDKTEELYYDDRHSDDGTPSTLATCGDYYAVNTYFFDTYVNPVDGGLFYCGSCYSASDGYRLASVMGRKGFDAYCGSKGSIMISYSDKMMYSVAQYLATVDENGEYPTLSAALTAAEEEHGEEDFLWHGSVILVTDNDFRLVETVWKEAYAEILRNVAAENSQAKFQLVYLDDDNIPELAISDAEFHVAGVTLYTYYDGEARELGTFGGFGEMEYASRENIFHSWYMGSGAEVSSYYSIKEGQRTSICSFSNYLSMEDFETLTYYINDVETTKTIYDSTLKAVTAGHTFSTISYANCVSITAANINKLEEDFTQLLELG